MAVSARDINVTREMVDGWLSTYKGDADLGMIRDYLAHKLDGQDLDDHEVDTSARTDIPADTANILDLLMDDLPSYDGYKKLFQ